MKKIRYQTFPLSGSFMLTGLLGFIVVSIYTFYGRLNPTWGVTFSVVFLTMLIASVISITPTFPRLSSKAK